MVRAVRERGKKNRFFIPSQLPTREGSPCSHQQGESFLSFPSSSLSPSPFLSPQVWCHHRRRSPFSGPRVTFFLFHEWSRYIMVWPLCCACCDFSLSTCPFSLSPNPILPSFSPFPQLKGPPVQTNRLVHLVHCSLFETVPSPEVCFSHQTRDDKVLNRVHIFLNLGFSTTNIP